MPAYIPLLGYNMRGQRLKPTMTEPPTYTLLGPDSFEINFLLLMQKWDSLTLCTSYLVWALTCFALRTTLYKPSQDFGTMTAFSLAATKLFLSERKQTISCVFSWENFFTSG